MTWFALVTKHPRNGLNVWDNCHRDDRDFIDGLIEMKLSMVTLLDHVTLMPPCIINDYDLV